MQTVHDAYVAQIQANSKIICVAANDLESPPTNYNLNITTQASLQNVTAGSAAAITDELTASNSGSSITENVNASVILHYTPKGGTEATASKTVSVSNTGTASASFTPSDFGFATGWEPGGASAYWFSDIFRTL